MEIQSQFLYLTNEQLEGSEEYSNVICGECLICLRSSSKFKALCLENQKVLKEKCGKIEKEVRAKKGRKPPTKKLPVIPQRVERKILPKVQGSPRIAPTQLPISVIPIQTLPLTPYIPPVKLEEPESIQNQNQQIIKYYINFPPEESSDSNQIPHTSQTTPTSVSNKIRIPRIPMNPNE